MKADFITIEIEYDDGSIQTWDYECVQYNSLHELRSNMTEDFTNPRTDRKTVMLHFTEGDNHHSLELEDLDVSGVKFTGLVFKKMAEVN